MIVLGEDRWLSRDSAPSRLADAVGEIARRAGAELRDLGMAVGDSGLLSIAFSSAPQWDAPSVGQERQEQLWAAAERTGQMAGKSAS